MRERERRKGKQGTQRNPSFNIRSARRVKETTESVELLANSGTVFTKE
jgi:hypothetical protein